MNSPSTAGYSGTPLAKKLGIKPGDSVVLIGAPAFMTKVVRDAGALPLLIADAKAVRGPVPLVHLFTDTAKVLEAALPPLKKAIAPNGMIWVSWPKKAAKVPTDITEDTIRTLALPMDLVDVKVCAVDAVWSGLKLVIRKEKR
jgi:hypothetical protein